MALEDELKEDINQLLSLKENFDDEGGMPPKKETIDKAIMYAKHMIEVVKNQTGIELITPNLWQDGRAGAAVYWRNYKKRRAPKKEGEFDILLTVHPDKIGSYYAEIWLAGHQNYHKYKGAFDEKTEKLAFISQ